MVVVLWLMAIALVALTFASPRSLWYATSAWQFKNPEANEPSEIVFALTRVLIGAFAVGAVVLAITTTISAYGPLTQSRLDSAGGRAASQLSAEYNFLTRPDGEDIKQAIGRDVVVHAPRTETDKGSAPWDVAGGSGDPDIVTEYYQITGLEDASIQGCMTFQYEDGLFADYEEDLVATYTPGAC